MHRIAMAVVMMTFPLYCAFAQHRHEGSADSSRAHGARTSMNHAGTNGIHNSLDAHEHHSGLLPTLPAQRDATGTAWLPDAAPTHGVHQMTPGWNWMFHWNTFLRITAQDAFSSGERGNTTMSAPNWLMVHGHRMWTGRDQVGLRGMFSLEPATESGDGYPLLFQSGEEWHGRALIDRQHPHDFFGELAATYGHTFSPTAGGFAYFGLAGEPALGPPAFVHRPSSQHNPDAPLGHHWQDATHITYGVFTLGTRLGDWKLDGSVFNGREPDDNRINIDAIRFDSYSGRVTLNPSAHWSVQASAGMLNEPERQHPGVDLYRYTASALYQVNVLGLGSWSNALIWGMNQPKGDRNVAEGFTASSDETQHSLGLESDLERWNHAYYTRVEWVQKDAADLGVAQLGNRRFDIGALTLGYAHDLARTRVLKLAVGGQGTLYTVPSDLQPEYGEFPVSMEVYLRMSPLRIL